MGCLTVQNTMLYSLPTTQHHEFVFVHCKSESGFEKIRKILAGDIYSRKKIWTLINAEFYAVSKPPKNCKKGHT